MMKEPFTPYAVLILLILIIVLAIVSVHSDDPLYADATSADKPAVLEAPRLGAPIPDTQSRGPARIIARNGLR